MTEEEYKAEWLLGFHQTDYNNCRFADDKVQYCKDWIEKNCKRNGYYISNLSRIVSEQKLKIATDSNYRELCANWSDKIKAMELLMASDMNNLAIPVLDYKYEKLRVQDLMNLDQSKA